MPAVSKAQQRFMGMVHATQKGDMENPSPEVEKAADGMTAKDSKEFASTKHAGLPDKKEDYAIRLKEHIRKLVKEMNTTGSVEGYNTPYAFSKKGGEKKTSATKQSGSVTTTPVQPELSSSLTRN